MSEDIHKWSDGRYALMFDEHTFFVWDNVKEERMTALETTKRLNKQQDTIFKLQDLCGKSDGENAKLRIENKRLQEENEQLKSERRNDAKEFSALFKQNFGLKRENEQLRQSVEYWQRKRVEKASEIQKECFKIKDIRIEKKYCGSCKHLHLDGMFDFWCDENHDWTLFNGNCSDFER